MARKRSSKKVFSHLHIKSLQKEKVVSRQLMLEFSSGDQKKSKAILNLEVRLKTLSTRFENHEIDGKQYLEGLSFFGANKK
jgi:hypothetical protein